MHELQKNFLVCHCERSVAIQKNIKAFNEESNNEVK
jgi:hypothetical protein